MYQGHVQALEAVKECYHNLANVTDNLMSEELLIAGIRYALCVC